MCAVALEAHRVMEEKAASLLLEWAEQGEPIIVLKCPYAPPLLSRVCDFTPLFTVCAVCMCVRRTLAEM